MDPAIKLFGKTIALSLCRQQDDGDNHDKCSSPSPEEKSEPIKPAATELSEVESSSNREENQQKPLLKKPDKILPCPRCNSRDTKFCYYNNYNVNQPRHFCKNCQRYWTAGGTMRNVPVGAGRRKTKNAPPPHYPHVAIPDPAHPAKGGTVLSFGPYPWGPTYWGYGPVQWVSSPVAMTPSGSGTSTVCSGSISPLGKRSREGESEEGRGNLWMPKTLRIDDPDEAAKSSYWATMGFDKSDHGLFKPFAKNCTEDDGKKLVCLNPAALSRSINFQENS